MLINVQRKRVLPITVVYFPSFWTFDFKVNFNFKGNTPLIYVAWMLSLRSDHHHKVMFPVKVNIEIMWHFLHILFVLFVLFLRKNFLDIESNMYLNYI